MFTLTSNEKLQLSLFRLMDAKAQYFLHEDCCSNQDIKSTKYQCLLLAVRKMCQVYKDLDGNSKQTQKLRHLIISYFKIIYHTKIDKEVKRAISNFLISPSRVNCNEIISAIYSLDIEDFSLYVFSNLIGHLNKGNPSREHFLNL